MHVKLHYQVSLISLGGGGWGKSKLRTNPAWAELGKNSTHIQWDDGGGRCIGVECCMIPTKYSFKEDLTMKYNRNISFKRLIRLILFLYFYVKNIFQGQKLTKLQHFKENPSDFV